MSQEIIPLIDEICGKILRQLALTQMADRKYIEVRKAVEKVKKEYAQ